MKENSAARNYSSEEYLRSKRIIDLEKNFSLLIDFLEEKGIIDKIQWENYLREKFPK